MTTCTIGSFVLASWCSSLVGYVSSQETQGRGEQTTTMEETRDAEGNLVDRKRTVETKKGNVTVIEEDDKDDGTVDRRRKITEKQEGNKITRTIEIDSDADGEIDRRDRETETKRHEGKVEITKTELDRDSDGTVDVTTVREESPREPGKAAQVPRTATTTIDNDNDGIIDVRIREAFARPGKLPSRRTIETLRGGKEVLKKVCERWILKPSGEREFNFILTITIDEGCDGSVEFTKTQKIAKKTVPD